MRVCIPTYMLASGLIAGGMSWWQAIGTILLGNLIVLVPMLLNAHAGAKYGIPVPGVRARVVRSARRQYSGRAARAGGLRMVRHPDAGSAARPSTPCSRSSGPRRAAFAGGVWVCFFAFWALNIAVIWRGIETIKFLEGIGAPFMLGVGLLLLWWITGKAGGLGPVLSAPSKFHTTARVPALLHPVAHRHGRLLGHRRAQHPRLHALRQIAEGADRGPGARPAHRHDALLVHRRRRHLGLGRALRRGHLGSGGAARPIQPAAWSPPSRWSRC